MFFFVDKYKMCNSLFSIINERVHRSTMENKSTAAAISKMTILNSVSGKDDFRIGSFL